MKKSFESLGLSEDLCRACQKLGWDAPTKIQEECIPIALKGNDVIGLSKTGSGKTGAFCLPMLQKLLTCKKFKGIFGLIIAPTAELAFQIKRHMDDLGKEIGLKCMAIVGGMDMKIQTVELAKKPHVVVGTIGRIIKHMFKKEKNEERNFLEHVKMLVIDEADAMLNKEFQDKIGKIIGSTGENRQTMLFSATMCTTVAELERAHLKDPVKIEVAKKDDFPTLYLNDPTKLEIISHKFESLGLIQQLCTSCSKLEWNVPTLTQVECIRSAIQGKDVYAIADRDEGKADAYCLAVLQKILTSTKRKANFALIIVKSNHRIRLLKKHMDDLVGKELGINYAMLGDVDGDIMMDVDKQITELETDHHILISTPTAIAAHLRRKMENFSLRKFKLLVLDETDDMVHQGCENIMEKIITSIARKRQILLFSAVSCNRVEAMVEAHLRDPLKVVVSTRQPLLNTYVKSIDQPKRIAYLVAILKRAGNGSVIVFCDTWINSVKVKLMLKYYKIDSVVLHSKMDSTERKTTLKKFIDKDPSILVTTNLGSRGLDVKDVKYVINFVVPETGRDYIHRVGRTARAGNSGIVITMVTQYTLGMYQDMERELQIVLPEYKELNDQNIDPYLLENVSKAKDYANKEFKLLEDKLSDNKNRKRSKQSENSNKRKKLK